MEVKNGNVFVKTVMFAEFLGTCGVMMMVNLSNDTAIKALVFYVMIMLTGPYSGGHLNPAVTFGVYIEQKEFSKNLMLMIGILFSQIVGALFALVIGYMLRV